MMKNDQKSTEELLDTGINYLIEKMGIVETERFISLLIKEKSDYTKWRRQYFDGVSSDDFHEAAVAYGKDNPL